MNKAYKFRIYPTQNQRTMFAKTFGCVRKIFNLMLGDKIKHFEETKEMLHNTPAQYKQMKDYEYLKEVDSLALANAQINLESAYNNFFKRPEIGFPKFKAKHRDKDSYTTNCVNNNIRLKGNKLRLPKIGTVKIKAHRVILEKHKLKSVTRRTHSKRRILCLNINRI